MPKLQVTKSGKLGKYKTYHINISPIEIKKAGWEKSDLLRCIWNDRTKMMEIEKVE